MSLRKSAVSGVKWSSVSVFGRRILSLLTSVVLARLLTPADFGLVAMAAVVSGFVELFRDMGTATAVIQRPNASDQLLSSVFWLNAAFGCTAMVLLLLTAPFLGVFYREPKVISILQMLSLSFPLSALGILQQALLERRLAFQTLAKIEIFSALVASAAGISAALLGRGAFSLVIQMLVGNLIGTVLLWLFARWRPKFIFRWSEIESVMNFSLNLTAFNIFNYFIRNADNFLIGRYLGTQELGIYDLAYRLMLYPLQGISAVIGRVMFPLYSRIQDDLARFRDTYLSIASAIAIASFPLMLGLLAVREPMVLTLFGDKWTRVTDLLVIFAPLGALQSIATTVGSIYQARGRTDHLFRWGIVAGSITVLSFVLGLHWGIVGVATAYFIVSLVLIYPSFAIPFKLIDLRVNRLSHVLWRTAACSLLMFSIVVLVSHVIPSSANGSVALSLEIAAGVVSYLTFTWVLNREQMLTLWAAW